MKPYKLKQGTCQWSFQRSRAKIQGFCGSFANGKSTGMIVKALRLVRDYPGSLGLMGRSTYPKLNDTLRKDFLAWCPPSWIKKRPTQDDNSCYFVNGSVVHFRYIAQKGKTSEDGSTTSNLLSATYDWIVVDQIEDPEIGHKDFLDLLGRLRGETPYKPSLAKGEKEDETMPSDGPRWFMFGANPCSGWVFNKVIRPWQRWYDRGIFSDDLIVDEESQLPLMELFESDIYANATNLRPDYIKSLEASYKGQMRERFLKGKWVSFEGLVYDTFDEQRNTLTRDQMIKHLLNCRKRHVRVRVMEAYDFGNVSPSCYLLSFVDELGRVFIIDGFYQAGFGYEFHPPAIMEVRYKYMGLLNTKEPILADPAIFRKQVVQGRTTGTSIAKLLREGGVEVAPAQSDVKAGVAKVSSYWSGRDDVEHILTSEMPGPMLYVCQDLTWYIDEITNYHWKKNPFGDNTDEPMDRNDHAMDCTKYLLSRLPEASRIVVPKDVLPPQWKFWHEFDPKERRYSRV